MFLQHLGTETVDIVILWYKDVSLIGKEIPLRREDVLTTVLLLEQRKSWEQPWTMAKQNLFSDIGFPVYSHNYHQ